MDTDDSKRDNSASKTKRNKSDHVKQAMTTYLQKRNYPLQQVSNVNKTEFATKSAIEAETSRSNSVLYSCYNSDLAATDHSFARFLNWVKDARNRKTYIDLEQLIPPLFCHLYLEILKGGHSEKATAFLKAHIQTVEKVKCDELVEDLIQSFADNVKDDSLDEFRSNKYSICLSSASLNALKKFIAENCHVVFLHVLQTWFDIEEIDEEDAALPEESIVVPAKKDNPKFEELENAINELKKEPKPLFCVHISNIKEDVICGIIKRSSGIIAYNQKNRVCVRSIHPYDTILNHKDCTELNFNGQDGRIYDIAISLKNEYLVTASSNNNVCIFDLINGKLQSTCEGHVGAVYCVAVSTPPTFVASGSYDSTARLWSTDNGHMLRIFIGHTQPITCVQFHPNNVYLATGSADGTIRLWSIEDGKPQRLFQPAKGVIYTIAIHPSGHHIASASDDKCLRVWEILRSKMVAEIKYNEDPTPPTEIECKEDLIRKLVWSKDGKYLGTGTINGVFRTWNFESLQQNHNTDIKVHEPSFTTQLHSKLLNIEYSYDSFACMTATSH